MANGIGTGSSSFRPQKSTGVTVDRSITPDPGAQPQGAAGVGAGGFAAGAFGNVQGAGFQGSPTGGVQGFSAPGAPQIPGPGPTFPQGQGGFSTAQRVLTAHEVNLLNQQLGTTGTTQAFTPHGFSTQQLLGPFGFAIDPTTFNRSQLPAIETRLNFENLLQAQFDRQSALNLIQQQRNVIGENPDQLAALDVARRRLAQPEPFTPEEVALQTGNIRSRAGRGLEASQRQFEESFARQGLAGSATSFQGAQLQQAADRQASDELSRLAIENALRRDVNEGQAVDRLQGITGENELRQIALNQALSELLNVQRGEFDLSALAAKERKSKRGLLSKIGFF